MRDVDGPDEAWARDVFARAVDLAPEVAVDVRSALRRGRRRRTARAVGLPGALAVAALGVAWVLPTVDRGSDVLTVPAGGPPTESAPARPSEGPSDEPTDQGPSEGADPTGAPTDSTGDPSADADGLEPGAQAAVGAEATRLAAEQAALLDQVFAARDDRRAAAEAELGPLTADQYVGLELDTAADVVDTFGLGRVPDAALVDVVPSGGWVEQMDTCLQERGPWNLARTTAGGWRLTLDAGGTRPLGASLYTCLVMYPEGA